MTLQEFWDLLNKHAWFACFSENTSKVIIADRNMVKLNDIAMESSEEYRELLVAFRRHKFSGPAYNTDRQPKPIRPE